VTASKTVTSGRGILAIKTTSPREIKCKNELVEFDRRLYGAMQYSKKKRV